MKGRIVGSRTIRRGQFGADNSALDNSALDNSARTIRATIRPVFICLTLCLTFGLKNLPINCF